jgi:diguanylate cyclase (GGDEF)-like protein/PAS domain S-box-containing protein
MNSIVEAVAEPFIGWRGWSVPLLLTVFLGVVAFNNFLLFHTLVELFAVMVAIILAVVAWHTHAFSRNHYLVFLGCGYFWIGVLDLFHALSFEGANILPNTDSNISIQFWLITRYLEALLLLSAPAFLTRQVNRVAAISFFGVGTIVTYYIVMSGHFPVVFIEGAGLTTFKVVSEYTVITLLLLAAGVLTSNRKLLDRRIYIFVVLSIFFTAFSELFFTVYSTLTSTSVFIGHILKMMSYWLIFVAIVRTTLTEPFQVMARGSSTYDAVPDPTIVVDKSGTIREVNEAACVVSELSADKLIGEACHKIFHPQEIPQEECVVCQHISNGKALSAFEMHFAHNQSWQEFTLTPITTIGDLTGMVHVSSDITVRKSAEQQLFHQANFDQLTQLPNRTLAMDRLEQAVKRAERDRNHTAVMFIDIDNFKSINDTCGHAIGDKLLSNIATTLKNLIRETDTVSRWGGDEFLVIMPSMNSVADAESVAEKILQHMKKPLVIDNRELLVSSSIGISGFPNDGRDAETLLSNADAAMYQAKEAGKNTFRFFTDEMNEKAIVRMELETQLRDAVKNNELSVHYQPQVDMHSAQIFGAEALLRWRTAHFGDVPPEQFIALAEESGLIIPIGEWLLESVCQDIVRWKNEGLGALRIAINISSRQIQSAGFVESVKAILNRYDIAPQSLCLEITETKSMDREAHNVDTLRSLKNLGFQLSLDDFGTGYSSLSYLKAFPFSEIKIDRTFVRDIATDPSDAALCVAIIAMAESLGLLVVGEGMETEEQLAFLQDNGADIVQGFYFSGPLPAEELYDFVKNVTNNDSMQQA